MAPIRGVRGQRGKFQQGDESDVLLQTLSTLRLKGPRPAVEEPDAGYRTMSKLPALVTNPKAPGGGGSSSRALAVSLADAHWAMDTADEAKQDFEAKPLLTELVELQMDRDMRTRYIVQADALNDWVCRELLKPTRLERLPVQGRRGPRQRDCWLPELGTSLQPPALDFSRTSHGTWRTGAHTHR